MASGLNSGINPEDVRKALTKLNTDYTNMMDCFKQTVQKFVDDIGKQWASPNAVNFFKSSEGVEFILKKLSNDINTSLKSVNSSINSAAERKASDNGSTFNRISFNDYTLTINYSSIVDNINGDVGVDKDNAETTANGLKNAIDDANTNLDCIRKTLETSGILDSVSQSTLNESVVTIKTNISTAIEDIVDTSIESIKLTVEQNGDSDGAIANAFRGQ